MIRFSYQQTRYRRLLAGTPAATLVAALRVPVAVIVTAALVVVAAWSLQTHRVAALDAQLADLQARIAATAADDARTKRLTADIAHLDAVQTRIASARRDVLEATNAIAEIGNGLPPQTWLTGVGSSPAGIWTIGGRSTHVDEIGTMLRRVQGIERGADARLVSVAAGGRTGRILDFVIAWERHT